MRNLDTRPIRTLAAVVVSTAVLAVSHPGRVAAQQWVATWGSSLQGASPEDWTVTDGSVRLIARSTIAGDQVRVRLENTFGEAPLRIGAATVGLQARGAALVAGSATVLRFDGSTTVTIPVGEYVVSDPATLAVRAEQRLVVSLHLPGSNVRSSVHSNGLTTSYITDARDGDQTGNVDGEPYAMTTTRMHWLSAIEVYSSSAHGAIVAFGDSITDGSCATVDGYDRWGDVLYARLLDTDAAAAGTARVAMVNAGIGGNTVIRVPPVGSVPGVERLDRDVLSLAGVTHVVLFLGTNDLRRNATAEQVIAGLDEVVRRAKARGLAVIGTTIIPRNPVPRGLPPELGFGASRNAERHAVNAWIRSNGDLDAVLDFDEVLMDSNDRDLINPIFDCDGIHPNVLGYGAMARSVDLALFADR